MLAQKRRKVSQTKSQSRKVTPTAQRASTPVAEAPDRGYLSGREAAEDRIAARSEAPDAGQPRVPGSDGDFTHGRSQS
jgi:hypothetical protein